MLKPVSEILIGLKGLPRVTARARLVESGCVSFESYTARLAQGRYPGFVLIGGPGYRLWLVHYVQTLPYLKPMVLVGQVTTLQFKRRFRREGHTALNTQEVVRDANVLRRKVRSAADQLLDCRCSHV